MPRLFGAAEPEEPTLPPGVVEGLRCAEDGCAGTLVLRPSKYGYFYACNRWPACNGTLPANKDGSPHGKPRKKSLQRARKRAHAAFDPMWKEGLVKRSVAYLWLQEVMGMEPEEAHMVAMTEEQCAKVERMVAEKGPGTPFWREWFSDLSPKNRKPPKRRRRRG